MFEKVIELHYCLPVTIPIVPSAKIVELELLPWNFSFPFPSTSLYSVGPALFFPLLPRLRNELLNVPFLTWIRKLQCNMNPSISDLKMVFPNTNYDDLDDIFSSSVCKDVPEMTIFSIIQQMCQRFCLETGFNIKEMFTFPKSEVIEEQKNTKELKPDVFLENLDGSKKPDGYIYFQPIFHNTESGQVPPQIANIDDSYVLVSMIKRYKNRFWPVLFSPEFGTYYELKNGRIQDILVVDSEEKKKNVSFMRARFPSWSLHPFFGSHDPTEVIVASIYISMSIVSELSLFSPCFPISKTKLSEFNNTTVFCVDENGTKEVNISLGMTINNILQNEVFSKNVNKSYLPALVINNMIVHIFQNDERILYPYKFIYFFEKNEKYLIINGIIQGYGIKCNSFPITMNEIMNKDQLFLSLYDFVDRKELIDDVPNKNFPFIISTPPKPELFDLFVNNPTGFPTVSQKLLSFNKNIASILYLCDDESQYQNDLRYIVGRFDLPYDFKLKKNAFQVYGPINFSEKMFFLILSPMGELINPEINLNMSILYFSILSLQIIISTNRSHYYNDLLDTLGIEKGQIIYHDDTKIQKLEKIESVVKSIGPRFRTYPREDLMGGYDSVFSETSDIQNCETLALMLKYLRDNYEKHKKYGQNDFFVRKSSL